MIQQQDIKEHSDTQSAHEALITLNVKGEQIAPFTTELEAELLNLTVLGLDMGHLARVLTTAANGTMPDERGTAYDNRGLPLKNQPQPVQGSLTDTLRGRVLTTALMLSAHRAGTVFTPAQRDEIIARVVEQMQPHMTLAKARRNEDAAREIFRRTESAALEALVVLEENEARAKELCLGGKLIVEALNSKLDQLTDAELTGAPVKQLTRSVNARRKESTLQLKRLTRQVWKLVDLTQKLEAAKCEFYSAADNLAEAVRVTETARANIPA